MHKLVLIMCFCLSLQACSSAPGGANAAKSDEPATIGNKAPEKKPEKNGLLAITQFMAVMSVLKIQVN